ncbi:glycine zipper 2TM domain-containing protein [Stenotrophomonas sp. YIM B06876]|uniref:glycine zipper 2TM domain-containing protein n=1 Tax=Stenotrophomonas sp. YIM B06876 TaxID=3060211 RepID=UPI002738C539|nr:glycine zipper 2TM domain-containing protein [Stenotrophomonas sp. YIM B06876]
MTRLAILAISLAFVGCANTTDPSTYSVGSVGQVNRSVPGTIISARPVTINTNTGTGGSVGGVAGAVAGSSIGGGTRANALGAVGGAVAGALVGSAIEQNGARQPGMEYVVSTSNGTLLTVTQGSEPRFQENDKVIILYGNPARVIRDPRT